MTENQVMYRILERATSGWFLHSDDDQHLTKEQCDQRLKELVYGGANPQDLKAIRQDDLRYPSPT